jgi:hypothetical protein
VDNESGQGADRVRVIGMLSRYLDLATGQLRTDAPLPRDAPFRPGEMDISSRDLQRLVRCGQVRQVVRGVFVLTELRDTLSLRAKALSLVVCPAAVVTDRTAAWLHGVDVLLPGEHLSVPPICVFDRKRGGRVRRPEVASGQRTLRASDVMQIDGVQVTTPLRTTCDLAMQRNRDRAFGSLNAMLHAGLVTKEQVEHELRRFKGRRYVRQLRSLLPWADSRHDSIAESITALRWYDTTPPYPQPQRPVTGRFGQPWSLDLGVDELYFAVEYDGEEFHTGDVAEEHDAERRTWIRRNTPWTVEVVTKDNIFGRDRDFEMLLPRWLAEAQRSLPDRLRGRQRWYDDVGD